MRPTATPAADPACPAEPTPEAPPDVYVRLDERVQQQYSVPARSVFAVVEVGGTQYKVAPNDVIVVEKLADVDVNDKLQLQRVLLLGSQAETIVGRPYVPHAAVTAAVEVRWAAVAAHARPLARSFRRAGGRFMHCAGLHDCFCLSRVLHRFLVRRSSSWTARCSSSTSGAGKTRAACAGTARCAVNSKGLVL